MRVPGRECHRFLHRLAALPSRHPPIGLVCAAIVEQQRHIDERERSPQVRERAGKTFANEFALYVVATVRDATLHAGLGELTGDYADENQYHGVALSLGISQFLELCTPAVGEHGLLDEGVLAVVRSSRSRRAASAACRDTAFGNAAGALRRAGRRTNGNPRGSRNVS